MYSKCCDRGKGRVLWEHRGQAQTLGTGEWSQGRLHQETMLKIRADVHFRRVTGCSADISNWRDCTENVGRSVRKQSSWEIMKPSADELAVGNVMVIKVILEISVDRSWDRLETLGERQTEILGSLQGFWFDYLGVLLKCGWGYKHFNFGLVRFQVLVGIAVAPGGDDGDS